MLSTGEAVASNVEADVDLHAVGARILLRRRVDSLHAGDARTSLAASESRNLSPSASTELIPHARPNWRTISGGQRE